MTDAKLRAALLREYKWRRKRYSENVNGLRKHGGNCFNEAHAAQVIEGLERMAEERGIDARAIRDEAYL